MDDSQVEEARKRMVTYCDLMHEIKLRRETMSLVARGAIQQVVHPRISEELCYLQLRMSCEALALACVFAHGDVEGANTKSMMKRYQADAILDKMATLHAGFFPRPVRVILNNGQIKRIIPVNEVKAFTREDVKRLYWGCGDILHRGTAEELSEKPRPIDFGKVQSYSDGLNRLLGSHEINSIDPTIKYLVQLNQWGFKVEGHILEDTGEIVPIDPETLK